MLDQSNIDAILMEEGAFIDYSCTVIHPDRLVLRRGAFIGAEGFIDASGGVEIGEAVRIRDRHRPVLVERGCWIGAGATIYPGVVIREGCVVNAGSVLMSSTEPNGLYCPPAASRVKDLATEAIRSLAGEQMQAENVSRGER